MHNAFRHLLHNDGDGSPHWINNPALCAHHLCGTYVTGALTFLEGKYKKNSWNRSGKTETDFDVFAQGNTSLAGISKARLDAYVCIRNAVVHNNCDLSKNDDKQSLTKVQNANLGGEIALNGSVFMLISDDAHDFMEPVRRSLVAVARYHGDG